MQFSSPPARLLNHQDRDTRSTASFDKVFRSKAVRIIMTPIRAPRANASTGRFVGTVRRECLDRNPHLQPLSRAGAVEYLGHYNQHRPRCSLDQRASQQFGFTPNPIVDPIRPVYKGAKSWVDSFTSTDLWREMAGRPFGIHRVTQPFSLGLLPSHTVARSEPHLIGPIVGVDDSGRDKMSAHRSGVLGRNSVVPGTEKLPDRAVRCELHAVGESVLAFHPEQPGSADGDGRGEGADAVAEAVAPREELRRRGRENESQTPTDDVAVDPLEELRDGKHCVGPGGSTGDSGRAECLATLGSFAPGGLALEVVREPSDAPCPGTGWRTRDQPASRFGARALPRPP